VTVAARASRRCANQREETMIATMHFSGWRAAAAGAVFASGLALPAAAWAQSAAEVASLAQCPPRQPVLRIAGVFTSEDFSPHPVENKFSSSSYSRLFLTPLFGADPWEEKVDSKYGVAESWTFLPGARGMDIQLRKGLTFNNGEPITAKDVAFSIDLYKSRFAEDQMAAALKGIGVTSKIIDDDHLRLAFGKGAPTFAQEFSTLVFPLYVTSAAYHSGGDISQESVDKFRASPLATGPYRVASRQARQFMTLEAARKDPLLGCPLYDRIEFRNIPETGTRMAQFRTGDQDIIAGDRDLIQQVKSMGARVDTKPGTAMIGLYLFQTYLPDNIFHDERVRKAAAYAIDHELIAKTIWKGIGVAPWGCTWPPSTEISIAHPDYVKACGTPYPHDPAKARQLLAEAGFASSKPAIKLVYWDNYPEEGALAEAMQPMLDEVGFNASIDRIDRVEFDRRTKNKGFANSIMFFGPGGRITSLAGDYFVYGPPMGPAHDPDVGKALARAAGAESLDEYMDAITEIGRYAHDRAYSPGFFSASSLFFVRKGLPDWGLDRSVGRSQINIVPLVADLKP